MHFTSFSYSLTEINLFKKPVYFASPPAVLESTYLGWKVSINFGRTSAPLTKDPIIGKSRFIVGVITASIFWDFKFLSRYPWGSI